MPMVKCHKCGHNNEEGHEFCEECGSKLKVELKCKKCGIHLKPDDDFCEECGKPIGIGKSSYVKYVIVGSVIIIVIVSIFLLTSLFKKPSKTIETTAPKIEVVQKTNVTVGEQKKPETLEKKQNVFTLLQMEYNSINKTTLRFVPYCGAVNDLGLLEIFVNNKEVFSAVPVCDSLYRQSIPKSVLNDGENSVEFKSNKGSYSVEQIKISLEVEGTESEKILSSVFLVESERKQENIDCNSIVPSNLVTLDFLGNAPPSEVMDNGRSRFNARVVIVSKSNEVLQNLNIRLTGFDPADFGKSFDDIKKPVNNLNPKESITVSFPINGEFVASDFPGNTPFTFRADLSFDYNGCSFKGYAYKEVLVKHS